MAHEGFYAARLGLRGIPGAAESIMVERDIALAELTGGHVHVAHMSARQSLRAVRDGKARGVRVTCEVAPHHFVLTDEALETPVRYDTNVKMNPPLREAADRDAMLEGLADGTVDVIATDHAPHHSDEKLVEFDRAPFGIVGLETCVPLVFDRLVHAGRITVGRAIELLSVNPGAHPAAAGRLAGRRGAGRRHGARAGRDRRDSRGRARARSRRTRRSTAGRCAGAVAATIVGGRIVYLREGVSKA